ncbi:Zn-ribbon domain-containing OB-fold protein [Pseudorhodoferax sp.]|uniref:Zn-ribbon domain-containing OB-fold protein n=1 Tax=Pseudorhodoferax sp. TaxID=1993553 RepID=UPI002DD69D39|nr:OB-fold domain-containing protein [Pseudorhodoferax sp.]
MHPNPAIPSPQPTPDTVPFWQAAAQGRLLLRRCGDCGRPHYYPRPNCPFCGGATDWMESAARGQVHAYSAMPRATPPYVICYVMLDEGVAMMSNIVRCAPERVHVGMRVHAVFEPSADGTPVPMFAPDSDGEQP